MSDRPACEHPEHLHCNVCGGAVCRSCYGTMAPTAQIKYGPSFPQNHTVARLNAQIAALTAQLTETQRLLEVQLAVGDKQEAEFKRLREVVEKQPCAPSCASNKCARCGSRHLQAASDEGHQFEVQPCDCWKRDVLGR